MAGRVVAARTASLFHFAERRRSVIRNAELVPWPVLRNAYLLYRVCITVLYRVCIPGDTECLEILSITHSLISDSPSLNSHPSDFRAYDFAKNV